MTPPPLIYDSSNTYCAHNRVKIAWEWSIGRVFFTHKSL